MSWIDTHAHLNDERFASDLDAVLDRAGAADVSDILVIGIDVASSEKALDLAGRHPILHAVIGIQPNSLGEVQDGDWARIVALASQANVVGIGETGLDRYWDFAPMPLQEDYFARHLTLACELDLPVVIHCREAEADVIGALRRFAENTGQPIRGVMHSFTGDVATAKACLSLGLYISFAGMVTFKKNDALRAVAAEVPLDRLLVETDSPYLSPHPVRGGRNEPANVIHTGRCLAEVHGVAAAELARITSANARALFARLP
jgi:TatD DNase family protein